MADEVTTEVTKEFGTTSIAQIITLGIARVFGELSTHTVFAFAAVLIVLTVRPLVIKRIKARHHTNPPAVVRKHARRR